MTTQPEFINLQDVMARTTLSRSSLYRLLQGKNFPSPYTINGVQNRKVWRVDEVDAWLNQNTQKAN